ncbi:MAG: hypothetical protein ACRESW_07455, partial [Nevskiales bacterium]
MARKAVFKYTLILLLLLVGVVVAYALYDAGRLPVPGAGNALRGTSAATEDVVWTPPRADSPASLQARAQLRAEKQLRQHKPWGIKPDNDDPRLSEEQRDEIKKAWKEQRNKFRELPKEQRQAIRQRCQAAVRDQPDFD